ncbi:MAG: sulfurtransferase TusA family protein [Prosthecochloris sp.]|nr:sulfurtransferase TusA family protein [Prosthecochloris sp.]
MLHFLDVTKERCPMTIVRAMLKLSQIEDGDLLDVLLMEGEPCDSVLRLVQQKGYLAEVLRQEGELYHVIIRK